MDVNVLIGITNFISRWILFLAVAYKAMKTKDKAWIVLTLAFFINALDVERYILNPLGIPIKPGAYELASIIPNFLFAFLAVWGALHILGEATVKHVKFLCVGIALVYVLLFFAATPEFDRIPFAIRRIPSSWVFGGALIYLGLVLRKHVIRKGGIEELFPIGLILLGALNITYPFTRNVKWFADIAFFLATVFRVIAAVGATKFVFYGVKPPEKVKRHCMLSSGAYIVTREKELLSKFPDLFIKNNVVVITRKHPQSFPQNVLVYWITKAKEGVLDEKQRVIAISPTKIDILVDLIAKALKAGYNLIYVDTFEYLVIENGFNAAFKFLLSLKDRAISENKVLIVVLSLEAFDKKERKLIEREFERI